MATTVTSRAYWSVVTVGFVLVFSIGSSAQARPAEAPSVARNLNSTLTELLRVAPATIQDLDLAHQQQGGKLHWVTFWRRDKVHNTELVDALRRNLQFAVPNLIHDTQASGGNLSTTFKLYRDLTTVCESLDSLFPLGSRANTPEFTALNNDLSTLNRLREELSFYIQQTAASIESKHPQLLSSAGQTPRKIIVDDNIPENSSPKNRRRTN